MEVSGRKPTKTDGHKTCLLCDPCKRENEDEPAVAYCTVCNDYLCRMCRKAHTRAKSSNGHPLLDGTGMPKQKPTSSKDSMCPKHNDKPLEYYCKDDDQFSCSVCATIDHKQCRVQYIDDIATDFHKSNEYVALEKATTDLIRLLQKTQGTATRNINGIESMHTNFISDLQQFRQEINYTLDLLENAAIKEAKIVRDSDQVTIYSIATSCDSMLSDIQSLTSELEELSKYKQTRQLVICSKRALKTVNTYGSRVNELSNQNRIRDYKFHPNEEIRRFLHSLNNFGNMKEVKYDEQSHHGTSTKNDHDSSLFTSATHIGDIDVHDSTDRDNHNTINGGVVIHETKLALIDYWNLSVKIADLDRNIIISCIHVPRYPEAITSVNQDQIVVACSDSFVKGKLVFLKVCPSLSVVKTMDIDVHPEGIVYTNDMFFVTDSVPDSVKAIDMKGNVLKTFGTRNDYFDLMFGPMHICISTDKQKVFVLDSTEQTVTSLALDGTVQNVYTMNSLGQAGNSICPEGLAVDRNDVVYIAGYGTHIIYQLSTDSNRIQAILDETDGVKSPRMVTYCKARHRLYISGKYSTVSVYQLH